MLLMDDTCAGLQVIFLNGEWSPCNCCFHSSLHLVSLHYAAVKIRRSRIFTGLHDSQRITVNFKSCFRYVTLYLRRPPFISMEMKVAQRRVNSDGPYRHQTGSINDSIASSGSLPPLLHW